MLFCDTCLGFNTVPCRHMPLVLHFWHKTKTKYSFALIPAPPVSTLKTDYARIPLRLPPRSFNCEPEGPRGGRDFIFRDHTYIHLFFPPTPFFGPCSRSGLEPRGVTSAQRLSECGARTGEDPEQEEGRVRVDLEEEECRVELDVEVEA